MTLGVYATETLIYAYAVLRPKAGRVPGALPEEGVVPGCEVELLAAGALLLAVSRVPATQFAEATLAEQLADAAWVQASAVAHQQVLSTLLADYTVLPLRFCTLYHDPARACESITAQHTALAVALNRLEGAQEWGVKLRGDAAALLRWTLEQAPELAAGRAALAEAPPGAAFFKRKQLQATAEKLLPTLQAQIVAEAQAALLPLVRAYVWGEPRSSAAPEQSADVLLNAALLVDEARTPALQARLGELGKRYAGYGLHLELSGPWPPYHFASL